MFKNALVSCSDKTGLVEFLKPLCDQGMRVVSTGGTANLLKSAGLTIFDVSEQTHFPEILDGRVKTLHPHIHMGLLARDDHAGDAATLARYGIAPFDLVVGNLYPFDQAPDVENIDIGGPSFLRASAKNFSRITVICDPADYAWISKKKDTTLLERQRLAVKIFSHTASYDAMIAAHFSKNQSLEHLPFQAMGGELIKVLRYGENAQQSAAWYKIRGENRGLHEALIHNGKDLSYNNILDLNAAVNTLRSVQQGYTCVAVKHNNPCGVAVHSNSEQALTKALSADPQSVFGGIVATNFPITQKMAQQLNEIFLECIIASQFTDEAIKTLSMKKNLRILSWPQICDVHPQTNYRSVLGGFLMQDSDHIESEWGESWSAKEKELSDAIKNDLLFAWRICANLKSNAIAIVSEGVTTGLGMGQVNRVDAVAQAIERSHRFHSEAKNLVLASDAFFPFADSIEKIAKAGIKYVIQPGGSVKDTEVIEAANKNDVTLIMTGTRHFLH